MGRADGGLPLCPLHKHSPPLALEEESSRDHEVPKDLAQVGGRCQHVGNKTEH